MEDWSQKQIDELDNKLKKARQADLRFFRVDEFKRNVERIGKYSNSCPVCQKEKIHVSEIIKIIDEAVSSPGKKRREYDRLISRVASHMQKEHGYFTPNYFTYLFAFFGMVAGLVFGYLLMKLFSENNWAFLSGGFTAGLIAGYVWGGQKDKRIRSEKKRM